MNVLRLFLNRSTPLSGAAALSRESAVGGGMRGATGVDFGQSTIDTTNTKDPGEGRS